MQYGNIEIKSLTLYDDWAELFVSSAPSFYSVLTKYQLSLTKMSEEETKEISHKVTEYQKANKELDETKEKVKLLKEEEQDEFLVQIKEYEETLEKLGYELAQKNIELSLTSGYTEQDLEKIKTARTAYLVELEQLLEFIANGIKQEDRETPLYSYSEYKKLPVGVKERLISDVARHEDNGINPSFLARLEAVLKKSTNS